MEKNFTTNLWNQKIQITVLIILIFMFHNLNMMTTAINVCHDIEIIFFYCHSWPVYPTNDQGIISFSNLKRAIKILTGISHKIMICMSILRCQNGLSKMPSTNNNLQQPIRHDHNFFNKSRKKSIFASSIIYFPYFYLCISIISMIFLSHTNVRIFKIFKNFIV